MKFRKILSFLVLLAMLLSAVACTPSENEDPKSQGKTFYEYFDTVSAVYSYAGDDETVFEDHAEAVREELNKYHRYFDIYYRYSGINNLATVNDKAGIEPVKVDAEIIEFLEYAIGMYELTDGEVNIAMGAVTSLWRRYRDAADEDPSSAAIPTEAELDEARKHVSIDTIVIDKAASTVYISDPRASLDVGAIAKGYATEKCAQLLISRAVTSYVLNIGGNIRIIGAKPSGSGFVTGITNPDKTSDESFVARIDIKDTSCVTSGSYERYYTVGEKNYHHVIDKDTLYPSEHFTSVTILCKDSGLADALSTALFCMSYEDGYALISKIGGVDVLWVRANGDLLMTDGMRRIIVEGK